MSYKWIAACVAACYVIGTFNPSYLISRFKGFDIRKAGSGNAGGSNAIITMGKKVGVICMIIDIFKAYAAVAVSKYLFASYADELFVVAVSSTSVILGHMFPVAMRFKGGKGLACLGGSLLAYSFPIAMIFLAVELILVFIVDYLVVVPITGSIAYVIVYAIRGGSWYGTAILSLVPIAMLYRHNTNFKRIREGKEAHFSFLWKREEEMNRVKEACSDEEFETFLIKERKSKKTKKVEE